MNKQYNEDKKSIQFVLTRTIDFIECVNIELSLNQKKGFDIIDPKKLIEAILKIKHINIIIYCYFKNMIGQIPHSPNIKYNPVYYKCYKRFHHFHNKINNYQYTIMSLDETIKYIIENNLSITLPNLKIT